MPGGYELPTIDETTTPQQASEMLNKVTADSLADELHPWLNGNHAQHRDFVERVSRLHELKARDSDQRSELEQGMQAGLDHQVEVQAARAEEARELMDTLVDEHGFERIDIPDDIQPWHVDILKMEQMQAEGDYDELTMAMRRELQSLKVPIELEQAFQSFASLLDMDENLRRNITTDVLEFIRDAHQQNAHQQKEETP